MRPTRCQLRYCRCCIILFVSKGGGRKPFKVPQSQGSRVPCSCRAPSRPSPRPRALWRHFWDASGTFMVHFLDTSETLLGHFWDTSGTALSLRHFRASLKSFENIATHYVSDLVQVKVPQASPAKLRNITFSYVCSLLFRETTFWKKSNEQNAFHREIQMNKQKVAGWWNENLYGFAVT